MKISLCLPAFNEEANIEKAITDSRHVLERIAADWEILVIDDGSRDNTSRIAEDIARDEPRIKVITHQTNRGYGAALITGFYSATKDWIWLSAADNQFEPGEIHKLLPFIDAYDLVVGYRYQRADPAYRRLYARLYNWLITVTLGIGIKDINCGFKLIKRGILEKLRLESSGALIDAEMFFRCKKEGFRIKEVAVEHRPRVYGRQTGGGLFVVIKMFIDLLKLKIRLGA